MPNPDVAENIINQLPQLKWAPAADAPVSSSLLYIVCPIDPNEDWRLARRTMDGWYWEESGALLEHDPIVIAALPRPPYGSKMVIRDLAAQITHFVDADEYDRAAGIIDELADAVRGVRSRPYRG